MKVQKKGASDFVQGSSVFEKTDPNNPRVIWKPAAPLPAGEYKLTLNTDAISEATSNQTFSGPNFTKQGPKT
jgi:hypothetical protein